MATLEDRAHDNLCGFVRLLARLQDADVLDAPGILVARAPDPFPAARLGIRSGAQVAADEFAQALDEFVAGSPPGAAVFAHAEGDAALRDVLSARGFAEFGRSPEMVCEARLEDRPVPDGVTVRLATDADDVRAFAGIAGHAFRHLSFPEEYTRRTVDRPSSVPS